MLKKIKIETARAAVLCWKENSSVITQNIKAQWE